MANKFNHRKTTQALNFFAVHEGRPIVKMKALKLLWLADRLHLRRYGRTITDDTYYAMKHGPVASNAHNIMRHNDSYLSGDTLEYSRRFVTETNPRMVASNDAVDYKVFSQTDKDALAEVYQEFGKLDEKALSQLSHLYPEWAQFEQALDGRLGIRFEMSFDDFFRNAADNNKIFAQDAELLALSQEMFHQPWQSGEWRILQHQMLGV